LDSFRSLEVDTTNPPCITSHEEYEKLQDALREGIRQLKEKVNTSG